MTQPIPATEIQASIMAVLCDGEPRTASEILPLMWRPTSKAWLNLALRHMTQAHILFRTYRGVGVAALYATTRTAIRSMPETRLCTVCGTVKPLDSAHFKLHQAIGRKPRLDATCRDCERRAARLKYLENRRLARKMKVIKRVDDEEAHHDHPISRTQTDHGTVIVRFHPGWRPTPNRHASSGFADGSSLNRIDL
jgi:hypothetical protein